MTPYEILGVPEDASEDAIRAAYKSAAQEVHPDREGGSADAFRAVREAYEALCGDDVAKLAKQKMEAMFRSFLESEDPVPNDMRRAFRDSIKVAIINLDQALNAKRKRISRATLVLGRIDPDSMLAQMARAMIEETKAEVAEMQKSHRALELVEREVADMQDDTSKIWPGVTAEIC